MIVSRVFCQCVDFTAYRQGSQREVRKNPQNLWEKRLWRSQVPLVFQEVRQGGYGVIRFGTADLAL